MKPTVRLALVFVAFTGCASPSPERQIISDAAAALGGIDRIQAVKTLTIEGEGMNGNLGQDMTPEATSQAFQVTGHRRAIDLAAERARIEQMRTPNYTYYLGPAAQRQVMGIDGDVGYNVAPDGAVTRLPDAATNDRRAELYHHPLTIVRAALNPATTLSNLRTEGNQRIVDITIPNGLTFTLALDESTKLPAHVTSRANHPILRDITIATSFADYRPASGLQLPTRLTTKTDDYTSAEIRVTKQTIDGEVDLAAPAAAASASRVAIAAPAVVTVEELSKGVWLLAGQSHHSVLVEFADHLTLIEAPQNETRSLAVIARAREIRSEKPLTHVVISHHHFDHSAGVRAAVAEGLTVITHKDSASFFEELAQRPSAIEPDALAKNPRPLKMETVDDQMVLSDGTMTVHLYAISGNPHGETLLMAHFPRERLLVQGDLFNPGSAMSPFAANLLENIRKRSLRIDRIVPIHGNVVPFGELVKAVSATASN